jgi:hypothetical protein
MRRQLIFACLTLALVVPGTASAAPYEGKIDYQGYEVTFDVKGKKVKNFKARMLQDCAGDGMSEQYWVVPDASWKIKGKKVSGKRVETIEGVKTTYVLKGKFSGKGFKGSIRAWDFIDGVGIVCDTLKRKFTAAR